MKAVVVYESMFGNTRRVAEAIAEGVKHSADVTIMQISHVDTGVLAAADLVFVGGPTHVHGMSRPATREQAGHMAVTSRLSLLAP